MSRLVAYMGSDPERLQAVLQEHRDLLQEELPPESGDTVASFGVGFYQGGEVLLQRRPRLNVRSVDLFEGLKELRTDAFLAQVQTGTASKQAKNENTAPFRFRSWIMAQQGRLPGFEQLREELLRQVPDFLRRNIRGQTECEHLFHLFLASLYEAGRGHLEDSNLPPELTLRALSVALSRLSAIIGQPNGSSGAGGLGPLQVALTNGRSLVVLRRGGEPLWLRRLSSLAGTERHHENLRGVLVFGGLAAAPREGAGLEEVPADHAVLIGRDLTPKIVPVPPAL